MSRDVISYQSAWLSYLGVLHDFAEFPEADPRISERHTAGHLGEPFPGRGGAAVAERDKTSVESFCDFIHRALQQLRAPHERRDDRVRRRPIQPQAGDLLAAPGRLESARVGRQGRVTCDPQRQLPAFIRRRHDLSPSGGGGDQEGGDGALQGDVREVLF